MDRKTFLKSCGAACLGGGIVTAVVQGCAAGYHYAQGTREGNRVTVKKAEFLYTDKRGTHDRRYVLVKADHLGYPICIFHHGEGRFTALLLRCTHNGCELQPQSDYLVCPCHGSEFTSQGQVKNPPAEHDLQSFNLTTDDDYIYLNV